MSKQSFADLGVSKAVVDSLRERGIEAPFPIQRQVIEDILDGDDVLVQSPTGSGKTLAFGVPLADLIAADSRRPAALILAPTRELASQIVDEMEGICHARALSIAAVYGGVGLQQQAKRAAKAHIIVACPGRLEDQIQRRAFSLENVKYLVLDEADRMLDMGFKPAVDRIVKQIDGGSPDALLLGHPRRCRRQARRRVHDRSEDPREQELTGEAGQDRAPFRSCLA